MKYTISIREVHISHRQVEAGSIDEAVSKATDGDYDREYLEFSHTTNDSQIDVYDTETNKLIVEDYKLA